MEDIPEFEIDFRQAYIQKFLNFDHSFLVKIIIIFLYSWISTIWKNNYFLASEILE